MKPLSVSKAKAGKGSGLRACPFCRALFTEDEGDTCHECGVELRDLAELPESSDAQLLLSEEAGPRGLAPTAPEAEAMKWNDFSYGRGLLALFALVGVGTFFVPWARESAPDVVLFTGHQLAKGRPFYWTTIVAWMVLVPAVLSRRSILKLYGARAACFVLASMPGVQCALLLRQQTHYVRYGVEFSYDWSVGLWMTLSLSIAASIVALRLGSTLIPKVVRTTPGREA